MEPNEIKSLIEDQGKAFEAFKTVLDGELKSKLAKDDPIVNEKLTRIEKALDTAVETKAALEAAINAERKQREELEARLNREGIKSSSEEGAKAELELKDFNKFLKTNAAERKQPFVEVDAKGYAEYKQAFESFMRKSERMLTPEEVKTLSVGSDPDGGYFVTPDLSGRIATRVYETSPMRQYASVQAISTDALEGIEDLNEAGAGYAGEQVQGTDQTTPQVGKWRISVYWIDTEPKATQQLLDDSAVNIEAWLAGKVADKFARFENQEFVTGTTSRIRGLIDYPTLADAGAGVTWGSIGRVDSGLNGDFMADANKPVDRLHDLVGTVKQAYLAGSAFFTRRSVVTKMRKFKDTTNQYLWQPSLVAGAPETFMGYPIVRMEDMPTLATNSLSLAFGNLGAAYQIVDRQGIRVLRDQFTSKPFVKFYTTKRVGGGMVNYEAIKFMRFTT
jgi:HK97 family phage major capsid protein